MFCATQVLLNLRALNCFSSLQIHPVFVGREVSWTLTWFLATQSALSEMRPWARHPGKVLPGSGVESWTCHLWRCSLALLPTDGVFCYKSVSCGQGGEGWGEAAEEVAQV